MWPIFAMALGVVIFDVGATAFFWPASQKAKPPTPQSSFFIDCVLASRPVKAPADGRVYSLNLLPHGGGGIFAEQIDSPGDDVHFMSDDARIWLYRCQVTNYGTAPLISADIPIKIRFMESVPNRQGVTIGKEPAREAR